MTDEKLTLEEIEQRETVLKQRENELGPSPLYVRGGGAPSITNESVRISDELGEIARELEDLKRQKDSLWRK